MTASDLRKTLEAHPKATCMIFCNPSNPTGAVADKHNLEQMADVLKDFPKVLILSDEIYERLTYDVPHVSVASLPGMYDRTVTVNGFSKSHSMTGFRIGYSAGPLTVAKATGKLQSQMTSCASSIGQQAALAALKETSPSWIVDRVKELKGKRDLALSLVATIPSVTCPVPNGAFYIMPDVKSYYGKKTPAGRSVKDSHELCLELLREEQVALVSGDAFGAPDTIRISYAASPELITESISRLKKFLLSLK
jgi:aspartate/methionine/tyrosine aminotransferase